MQLLPLKKDPDRYQTTSLEKKWKPVLHVLELNLGIPLDLLDMIIYNRPKGELPVLDPEDEELLRSDDDDNATTAMKADDIKRKERPTDKSVPLLVKTQYISPLSMDLTKQSLAETEVKQLQTHKTQKLLNHCNNRERTIQGIIHTFEACKSQPVHAFNHQLKPERIFPLFLYIDPYNVQFVVANFACDPAADSEIYSELNASDRIKLESRAIMKSYRASGTDKEEADNFLAYMVPSIYELEKGNCDENEDMSYSLVRNYCFDVKTEKEPETYLVVFGNQKPIYLLPSHGGSPMIDTVPTLQEEANSELNRLNYFRRCKKSTLTSIDSLPDDLLFDILVHLPAQFLHDMARLVCRKWYCLINTRNFISQHLTHHPTTGLLIECTPAKKPPIFATIQQGRIEISYFTQKFKDAVWAACNGLILQRDRDVLYIVNPATKQLFKLPPILGGAATRSGIAYAAKSMKYKVVHSYHTEEDELICAILTIGVDNSWRRVNIEHLPIEYQGFLVKAPLATDGFMHWDVRNTHVLTLNVETEIIMQISVPQVCDYVRYLSSESFLSLLVRRNSYLWEVWEMKPETGKWTKLQNLDLEDHKCAFEKFPSGYIWPPRPVGWLKYGEVVVLYGSREEDLVWIAYNIRTKEIDDVFELGRVSDIVGDRVSYRFIVHRNNLVW